jgi:hypothetical protein
MQIITYARHYGFAVYWVVFAGYTAYLAQFPGLMLHPERWTYPWRSVLFIWALLAVLIGLLYLILRPVTYRRSWGRLVSALIYAGAMLAAGIFTVVTDMPGHAYVPAIFGLVTFALVVVLLFVQISTAVWARWRHAT